MYTCGYRRGNMKKQIFAGLLAVVLSITGCGGSSPAGNKDAESAQGTTQAAVQEAEQSAAQGVTQAAAQDEEQPGEQKTVHGIRGKAASEFEPIESENGNIVILYTNDVHCAVENGIGYSGLAAYKKKMQEEGNAVFLIDDGDAIQGGIFGSLTKGDAIINLMNDVGYDLAIPGNHEFDYGAARFLELVSKAEYPYICCNFDDIQKDEIVLDSYVIREIGGKKIGFIGALTPLTTSASAPANFQDENGEFKYGYLRTDDGEALYKRIQEAVDAVHAEGVDYTFLVSHLGIEESTKPFMSVDVIRNTTGIDVVLDGHSHSTVPMELVKNKDRKDVVLTQTGTQFKSIGKLTIDANGKISTELVTEVDEKDEEILAAIEKERAAFQDKVSAHIAHSDFELMVNEGEIQLVRNNETNLGDLIADAFRKATGAEIAIVNSGGIRENIPAGDITYGDILTAIPYINEMCAIKAKGQAIADVLEFSARKAPEPNGGFMQVSGISFDIDLDKNAQVQVDNNGMFVAFGSDERRVSNIKVNGEPLDPDREYILGGTLYVLAQQGGGITFFDGAELVDLERNMLDIDAVAEYLGSMGGTVSEEYADPYGQERIHFVNE